ncbi:MAG TPA: deoxyribodipyrimidine photo-lyase [Methanocella sp.]|uniref:deoxyribodipyrimidine photo-lyase n=1 Tax=Methanocella sp. TaxID=2052833 RepID=UPI002C041657|nr:deoxyribodipyrimidine photo-lyase [Methanocella sp.]HTY90416.1 deoxyribodipyrimidine photo-lyase [Methanocella sp.]
MTEPGGRITALNDAPTRSGDCVVYWAQSSLRTVENPALAFAAEKANSLGLPLLVFYAIDSSIPMANLRNFTFMMEGLNDFISNLGPSGADVCVRRGNAVENVVELCREVKAATLVADESHLNEGRKRRSLVAGRVRLPMFQADANVIVPVRLLPGEQYAAYTIRPRLMKLLDAHIEPRRMPAIMYRKAPATWSDGPRIDLKKLRLPEVPPSDRYRGGETRALRTLREFVDGRLDGYAENRNDPGIDGQSGLSPYLRFGHISPALMLREVMDSGRRQEDIDAFVDEAFVRRELAENFTFYDPDYRSLSSLRGWAKSTIEAHREDRRPKLFTLGELEAGETGDELWDASQFEMVTHGKMAGYMRMYWGKRVIGWSNTPEEALRRLQFLNDKYELDGRSPNGYAAIMWCFGKHDRAFAERPVYGKLRYMSPAGTEKKFRLEDYEKRIGYKEKVTAH